jgi:hypothetical protein
MRHISLMTDEVEPILSLLNTGDPASIAGANAFHMDATLMSLPGSNPLHPSIVHLPRVQTLTVRFHCLRRGGYSGHTETTFRICCHHIFRNTRNLKISRPMPQSLVSCTRVIFSTFSFDLICA